MDVKKIPIVDLGPLTSTANPSEEAWTAASKAIGDACLNIGFFYVKNHGIEQRLVHDIFKYATLINSRIYLSFIRLPWELEMVSRSILGASTFVLVGHFPLSLFLSTDLSVLKIIIFFFLLFC